MEISILPSDIVNLLKDLKKIREISNRNRLLKKKCGVHQKMHYPKDLYLGKYQKYRVERKINDANLIYLIIHLKEVILFTILLLHPKFASEHQLNKEFYSLPYLLNYLIRILKKHDMMHQFQEIENFKLDTKIRGGGKENKFRKQVYLNNELENYFESNDMDASQKRKLISEGRKKSTRPTQNESSDYEYNNETYINTDYESSVFHRQLKQQQKLLRELDKLKYMKKLKNKDVQLLSNQLSSIEKMLEGADLSKIIPTVGDEPIPSRFKRVVDGVDLREIPNDKIELFLQITKTKNEIDERIEQLRRQKDSLSILNNSENKKAKIAKVKEEASQLKQKRSEILEQIKQMKNEKKQQIEKMREEADKENSVPLFTKKFGSLAPNKLQNFNFNENETEYQSLEEDNNKNQGPNSASQRENNNNKSREANSQLANSQKVNTQLANSQKVNTQLVNSQKVNTQLVNSQKVNTQLVNSQKVNTQLVNSQKVNTQLVNSQTNNLRVANNENKPQNQKEEEKPRKPEKEQIVEVLANINKLREHYQRNIILFRRLVGIIIYDKHLQMIVTYISNNWESIKSQIYTKLDLYNRSLNLYNIISNKNKVIINDLKKAIDNNKNEYTKLLNSEILPYVSDRNTYVLTENSLRLVEPIFNQVNMEFNSIKTHYVKLRDNNDIQNYKIMDVETYDIVQPSAKLFRDFAVIANINVDEGTESLASITPSNNSSRIYANLQSKLSNKKPNQNIIKLNVPTVEESTIDVPTLESESESPENQNEYYNTQTNFANDEQLVTNLTLEEGEDADEEYLAPDEEEEVEPTDEEVKTIDEEGDDEDDTNNLFQEFETRKEDDA
jgi:hypothetical protein